MISSHVGTLHRTFLSIFIARFVEQVLGDMGDDLVDAVKEAAKKPSTLSAASSYQRARENCRKEVQDGQNVAMLKLL